MTSSRPKGENSSLFTAPTLQFSKEILLDNLQDKKIFIPKMFVRKNGHLLTNSVLLKVPTGAVWHVKLLKSDGKVWLQDGWQEFADYHSLEHGDFVVFKYEGNSQFSVVIFDKSGSQIEYPVNSAHGVGGFQFREAEEEEDTDDDNSIEIVGEFSPNLRQREKSPVPCSCSRLRTRTTAQKFEGGGGMSSCQKFRRTDHATMPALQRAFTFTPKNPFFRIPIKSSHIPPQCLLTIPAWFSNEFVSASQGDMILTRNGKSWRTKYCESKSRGKRRLRLQKGWIGFARDNHLAVGDVCVFELIKGSEITLEVVIFS